jgi:hypothetical protein
MHETLLTCELSITTALILQEATMPDEDLEEYRNYVKNKQLPELANLLKNINKENFPGRYKILEELIAVRNSK